MGIIEKIKSKTSSSNSNSDEQQFSIQPHPAKTNNPLDVENPQLGGGLNSDSTYEAYHAKGPYQPSQEVRSNMPAPKTHEELQARAAELNK